MKELEWLLALTPANLTLQELLLLFMLIFCRWAVMSAVMPFLGAVLIPSLVRIALAGSFSLVSLMMIAGTTTVPSSIDIITVIVLFSKEVLVGFILGFLASLIFYAYELVGELLDFSRAASMLRVLLPHIKHQSSPMGTLLFQLSLTFFFALGLHRPMILALAQSFERFPPFSLALDLSYESFMAIMISVLGTLFALALKLALPVIFICFLIDLAFGLLNRVAPQIHAYFLSLPAKMMGGLAMLLFLLPLVMNEFANHNLQLSAFFRAVMVNSP